MHRARIRRGEAEQALRQLRTASTNETVNAESLATAHRERNILEFLRSRQILDAQQLLAQRRFQFREQLLHRASDHQPDQLLRVGVRDDAVAHRRAIAKHGVAIGEGKDLFELVADK
jgi:hypothetical protein